MAHTIFFALLQLTQLGVTEDTRHRIEAEVRGYLSSLCPSQCELADVQVKVAPRKAPVGTTPGFEELAPDAKEFEVQSVEVGIMVDKRLTGDFRSGLKQMIERRLAGQGYKATVRESILKMPLPQDLPQTPPMMPQMPQMQMQPAPEKKDPAAPLEAGMASRTWIDRLLDSLPLLLGLALCAVVVAYTLRQYARLLEPRIHDAAQPKKDVQPAAAAAVAKAEAAQADKELAGLSARLQESPSLRREVFRTWLREGQPADVALAVATLGPAMLGEVRADPECQDGLDALDAHLTELDPESSPEARARLASELKRRVLRADVRRSGDALSDVMAQLAGSDEAAFVEALGAEEEDVRMALTRHAPERLQQAVFAARGSGEQARLVRALLMPDAVSRERLLDAAERIRTRVSGQAAGTTARQARVAAQLVEAADEPERRRILAALRTADAAAYRRVLGELVTEETLSALPGDVLGAALLRLDVGQAALALSGLPGPARMKMLAALPAQQARAIEEESELLQASGARRDAARRAVFAEVRRAAADRGVDLYEVNTRAWRDPRVDEEAIA